MDYFSLLIIGFIIGLSGAMLPGPLLVYTVSKTLQTKTRSALWIVLGHVFIEAVMVVLLLVGLKQIVGLKTVSNILSISGAVALILMGAHIIFRAKQMKLFLDRNINFSPGLIFGGIFFTAFNPTFPVWWVSVGASLLSRALLFGFAGVIMLILGHWLADLAWFSLVGFVVARGKLWLDDRKYQLILRALGAILIGLGGWFIFGVARSR